jgi:hypothetical protein
MVTIFTQRLAMVCVETIQDLIIPYCQLKVYIFCYSS